MGDTVGAMKEKKAGLEPKLDSEMVLQRDERCVDGLLIATPGHRVTNGVPPDLEE